MPNEVLIRAAEFRELVIAQWRPPSLEEIEELFEKHGGTFAMNNTLYRLVIHNPTISESDLKFLSEIQVRWP